MVVWLGALGVVWACAIALSLWVRSAPIRDADEFDACALFRVIQVYARVAHRVRYEGLEHARVAESWQREGRPVIVAPNHTAGIDPLLVMAPLEFEPRWMMAADMRAKSLEDLWQIARIIFVDRENNDSASLRTGLRHLKEGKALGVFPEGHIERPPRTLLPFKAGIGLLARSTGALVLPVVIDGTPQVDPAWASIKRVSRSRVRFLEPVEYKKGGRDAESIAKDLERRFVDATGWATTERVPIVTNGYRIMIDLSGAYYDDRTGERMTDDAVGRILHEIGEA